MAARSLELSKTNPAPHRAADEHRRSADAVAERRAESSEVIQQKDELILALTEQLEQAAEQLDRLQRQGADRHRSPAGNAALPAELVNDQRQMLEELQRVVHQWEDMQAGLTLGRIEIQISELRDLIVQGQQQPVAGLIMPAPGSPAQIYQESPEFEAAEAASGSEWERMKSRLLQAEEPQQQESSTWIEQTPQLPDAPEPVNVDSADHQTLARAVAVRDDYISRLRDRLRQVEAIKPAAELLQHDPGSAEFMKRVQWLEQRLEEHLRSAEVELSVERARIARERAQLTQQQEFLERQLKKLGLSSADQAEAGSAAPASQQERRWARFLGRS